MPVYPRAVFLVISFLFGLSSVFGQEAKRALNSSDIDGWVNFSATTMSPSGKWIAYGAFPQHGALPALANENVINAPPCSKVNGKANTCSAVWS